MNRIDRYVFKEWAVGFALTFGVVLGVLVLQNVYDSLPDLLEADAGIRDILFFYAVALPTYVPTVLPIIFLVSLLFTLGNLHRNNEIVAMRACGRSLWQISRSLWAAGLVLSVVLLYLTASLVPRAVESSRTFLENLEYAALEKEAGRNEIGMIRSLGFDNRKDRRLWFMDRFSERAWVGEGVNVHTRNAEGREVRRISAQEAYFDDTQGHWVFVDGREMVFDPETGDPLQAMPFEEKTVEAYEEDPGLMLALHKEPKELSLFELREIIATAPPEENPVVHGYLVRYYGLFAAPFSCLVVVGLAVPFAVSGVRAGPMIGVSKCMVFFAMFYVLISLGSVLGGRDLIPAWLAAWLPNLVMLAVGLRFLWKAR
ncbi:MAG: LptF/LptG family permease [Opitutales bacterium]